MKPIRDRRILPRISNEAVADRPLTDEEVTLWFGYARDIRPLPRGERYQETTPRLWGPSPSRRAPNAVVDLHGLTEEEAYAFLLDMVDYAVGHGWRELVVITGKGRERQGILRRMVPRWLERQPQVLAIRQAPVQKGGEGALLVQLRRSRKASDGV